VKNGCIVIRFAALSNFDQIDVRGRQARKTENKRVFEPTTCVNCDFEVFPINFCHDRQEIFAVVSFTEEREYRVDFNFLKETIRVASVPYFFNVSGTPALNVISVDAIIPQTRVYPPLPTYQFASIEPVASKVVTLKQSEEVVLTIPQGTRLAVNLRDRQGRLARCALKERIEKLDCVVHRFVLLFPTYGQFWLAVYLDMNLIFNQRYSYLDSRVEKDPSEEVAIQNALAQRIEKLTETRLLSDIPETVKMLVRSWI
jgi:hypothetical protein